MRFGLPFFYYFFFSASLIFAQQAPQLYPQKWQRYDSHDGYVLGNGQMYMVAGLGKQLNRNGKSQLSNRPADYNRIAWIIGPSYTVGNLGYGWEPIPVVEGDTLRWDDQSTISPGGQYSFWGVESMHPQLETSTQDILLENSNVFIRVMKIQKPQNSARGAVQLFLPVYPDPRNSLYAMFNGQEVDTTQIERWQNACGPNLKPRNSIPASELKKMDPASGSILLYGTNHALWQEVSTTVPNDKTYKKLFPYRAAATSVKAEDTNTKITLQEKGFSIDLGTLSPGESRTLYVYIVTEAGNKKWVGKQALSTLKKWKAKNPKILVQSAQGAQQDFLFTSSDDASTPLLQSINACLNLALACKPSDGGTMAQPYMYPMYYVRDQYGPYKLLLAAGEYEKALNILQFYVAKQNHEGIQNAHDLFIKTPNPAKWLSDANARNGHHSIAEVPSYIILMARDYYRATGDLESLRSLYPRLKYNLAIQAESKNGVLPFAGDESYTNRSETIPKYRDEMTDSHLLFMAAADFMKYLAQDMGRTAEARAFAQTYEQAKNVLLERMWLSEEQHFVYAREANNDPNKQDMRPAFDALLRWFYLEMGEPTDSIPQYNLEAVLKKLTEPIRVVPEFEWCAGMDPGYLLYALFRSQDIRAHAAAELLLDYASDQGLYSEYYLYEGDTIIPTGGTLRPWESSINGYTLIQYLTGLRFDIPNQSLSLQPHLPQGWTHWKSKALPLYQEGSLQIELSKSGQEITCTIKRRGGQQELRLDLEFGLFGEKIRSTDQDLQADAQRTDLLATRTVLPTDGKLTFQFTIEREYSDQ